MVEVRWGSRLVNDGLLLSRFGLDDVNVVNGSSCNGVSWVYGSANNSVRVMNGPVYNDLRVMNGSANNSVRVVNGSTNNSMRVVMDRPVYNSVCVVVNGSVVGVMVMMRRVSLVDVMVVNVLITTQRRCGTNRPTNCPDSKWLFLHNSRYLRTIYNHCRGLKTGLTCTQNHLLGSEVKRAILVNDNRSLLVSLWLLYHCDFWHLVDDLRRFVIGRCFFLGALPSKRLLCLIHDFIPEVSGIDGSLFGFFEGAYTLCRLRLANFDCLRLATMVKDLLLWWLGHHDDLLVLLRQAKLRLI